MEKIEIKGLSIRVLRSPRRKTVELSVERDGQIVLRAPESAERERLERLAGEKLIWIYRQLGRKEEALHRLPKKEFVSGEGFYYRGRKYRLKLIDEPQEGRKEESLVFRQGRFWMPRELAVKGREIFVWWYGRQAGEWISKRLRLLRNRAGVKPSSVEIRDLGFRWGSCTRSGKLLFHWRLILLPPERIDYLIAHELVHLHEHNHSPAFYERLRRAAPEWERQEDWLRLNGDLYDL